MLLLLTNRHVVIRTTARVAYAIHDYWKYKAPPDIDIWPQKHLVSMGLVYILRLQNCSSPDVTVVPPTMSENWVPHSFRCWGTDPGRWKWISSSFERMQYAHCHSPWMHTSIINVEWMLFPVNIRPELSSVPFSRFPCFLTTKHQYSRRP